MLVGVAVSTDVCKNSTTQESDKQNPPAQAPDVQTESVLAPLKGKTKGLLRGAESSCASKYQ